MITDIIPLFESYDRFVELDHDHLTQEQPEVISYLESFAENLCALDGYLAVRRFLRDYEGSQATYNSYRTHVERLLLWTLLICRKPLLAINRQDCADFMEFCLDPPPAWIGPPVKARFKRVGGRIAMPTDTYSVNSVWRPFFLTVKKPDLKAAREQNMEPAIKPYTLTQGSIVQIQSVCGRFFQWAADQGLTDKANPIRGMKQKSQYKERVAPTEKIKTLTTLQWEFVLETAKMMADNDPELHERTLFIVATIYSMYLRVSDIVGWNNWNPMMGDFRKDIQGHWWFHVVDRGNKSAKISVKEEYMSVWMARYRQSLRLPSAPSPMEDTPLLQSLKGRAGLSEGYIRQLVQGVFDNALMRMRTSGFPETDIKNLRSASVHWLRHTAATADVKVRSHKDLQADLRHRHVGTTLDRYDHRDDDDRHGSNKNLS